METNEMLKNSARNNCLASTLGKVKNVFYGEAILGVAVLGYGLIDSITEAEFNVNPTVLGVTMTYMGAVGGASMSILENINRIQAKSERNRANKQIRSERHRDHYETKRRALTMQKLGRLIRQNETYYY